MSPSCERESKRERGMLVMHAVLWAAVILATAVIVANAGGGDAFTSMLIIVLIPSWFASDQLLRRAIRGR